MWLHENTGFGIRSCEPTSNYSSQWLCLTRHSQGLVCLRLFLSPLLVWMSVCTTESDENNYLQFCMFVKSGLFCSGMALVGLFSTTEMCPQHFIPCTDCVGRKSYIISSKCSCQHSVLPHNKITSKCLSRLIGMDSLSCLYVHTGTWLHSFCMASEASAIEMIWFNASFQVQWFTLIPANHLGI